MRSEIDVLLDKIDDATLRANLRSQVERIRAKRTFGLVFESHLPERVRLPEHPVRVGVNVAHRDDAQSPAFEVLAITGSTVTMRKVRDPDGSLLSLERAGVAANETAPINSLVVIADFGEPVFPGLRHLGSVEHGAEKPTHVVIKGENHHALEALQFTHAGKVDCIYIDPPITPEHETGSMTTTMWTRATPTDTANGWRSWSAGWRSPSSSSDRKIRC